MERELPEIFRSLVALFTAGNPPSARRLVTAKRTERYAKLLSGVISGWSKKYHHCAARF